MSIEDYAHAVPTDRTIGDPFSSPSTVPVAGGNLSWAHAGLPPDEAEVVVLAIHGITGNFMAWRSVARHVDRSAGMSILAVDLRGRGRSVALPGPYGIATHVADMIALLDHVGVHRAVLAGHSMGGFVAARFAAEHPDRTAGLVLIDGGVSVGHVDKDAIEAGHALVVGAARARAAMVFTSADAYLDFWRNHPALASAWDDDVDAYVLHDLVGRPGALRYVVNVQAIETDSGEIVSSDPIIDSVRMPVHLLRAPRGTLDDDYPMIPQPLLETFISQHPAAEVEEVEGVNHYTLLLGNSPGPGRVAAALEATAQVAINA